MKKENEGKKTESKQKQSFITYPTGLSIVQTRIRSPINSLVMRKVARSLSFKKENAFAQSLAIIMARKSYRKTEEDQKQRSQRSKSHKVVHIEQ